MSTNPYATPTSNVVKPLDTSIVINYDGKHVIVKNETALPNFCVKCGKKGHKRQKRTLHWVNPWWYLTILISFLITIIASIFVTRRLKITYYLCDEHFKKKTNYKRIVWLSFLLIVGAFITTAYLSDTGKISENTSLIIFLSLAGLSIVWLIVALFNQNDFNIKKAVKLLPVEGKKQYLFHLKGISNDFLKAINII